MANEDLGVKRDCPNCGARFYDLKKDPALCPKCGHEFTPDVLLKSRKRIREEEQSTSKPPVQTEEDAEELDEDIKEIDAEAENTTSLSDADDETAAVKSKRAKSLDADDDDDDDDKDEDDELANIDDIDLPDEEDDDTLLDDEEDDTDIAAGIATGKGDDD